MVDGMNPASLTVKARTCKGHFSRIVWGVSERLFSPQAPDSILDPMTELYCGEQSCRRIIARLYFPSFLKRHCRNSFGGRKQG